MAVALCRPRGGVRAGAYAEGHPSRSCFPGEGGPVKMVAQPDPVSSSSNGVEYFRPPAPPALAEAVLQKSPTRTQRSQSCAPGVHNLIAEPGRRNPSHSLTLVHRLGS